MTAKTTAKKNQGLQPIIGSNPILDNPLNPVYDVEGIIRDANQTGHDANQIGKKVSTAANDVGKVINTGAKGASAVGSAVTFLTSGENWIRLLEVIAGVVLVVMGLRTLSGHNTTPVSVTTGAARAAAKVAR